MSDKKLVLSSSPHFVAGLNTQKIMLCVIIALLPQIVAGTIIFGYKALVTVLIALVSCVFFEYLFQKITKNKNTIGNLSACVSGIMLALVCPPTIPWWMIVIGSFVAMFIAKGLFGGIGSNVFNPALTGRAVLFLSFPFAMGASWLEPKTIMPIDAISSATTLSHIKASSFVFEDNTLWQYFIGNRAGCIGETSILLILISFIFLAVTRIIDWRAPFAMIATVFLGTFFAYLGEGFSTAALQGLFALLTGGVAFGATFMVTDYATSPVTKKGRLLFGFGSGLITFLIRQFGAYPEGVMFSILIMNTLVPFLNNLTSRMYGYSKNKKEGGKA